MKILGCVPLMLVALSVGCGTGGSSDPSLSGRCAVSDGGTSPVPTGTATSTPDAPLYPDSGLTTHPLFSDGVQIKVDPNDPCQNAPIWQVSESLTIVTGLVVVYENVLWKITGAGINDNYTMADCTPPGTTGSGQCGERYAWQQVGTCP